MVSIEDAFEGATPLTRKLAAAGHYGSPEELIRRARSLLAGLSEEERIATLSAHPPIGADPRSLSPRALREQGNDVAPELPALNAEYERRFGFRFVVFVNRRPKSEIVRELQERLQRGRAEEMAAGLEAVIAIAQARLATRGHE